MAAAASSHVPPADSRPVRPRLALAALLAAVLTLAPVVGPPAPHALPAGPTAAGAAEARDGLDPAAPNGAIEPLSLPDPSTEATPPPAGQTTATTPPAPRPAPLIVIDPGHGGPYSNANANGLREKTVNLRVARALRDALVARGYRVVMTRYSDRAVERRDIPTWRYRRSTGTWSLSRDGRTGLYPSYPADDLQARVDIANRLGADLFISVHANGARSRRARGYETFASPRDAFGRRLAPVVQREVVLRTGLRDRRAKLADFYVLRWSDMPAILVETGFITNASDARRLSSPAFRRRVARAIASAADTWMRANPPRALYPRVSATDPRAFSLAAARSAGTSPTAVIVARERDWAALPGVPAFAASLDAPLVLVPPSGPDTRTVELLTARAPQRVWVLDPAGSVDETAVAALARASSLETASVSVIASDSVPALSGEIAALSRRGAAAPVFIVDERDTVAARATAPVAALRRAPVLVARDGRLSTGTAEWLGALPPTTRVVLVGPAAALPSALAAGRPVTRHGGSSVSTLLAALNARYVTTATSSHARPLVADPRHGAAFLVSATRAGILRQPLIAASGQAVPARTREWITNRRGRIVGFEVHDPTGAVPPALDRALRKMEHL